MIPPYIMSKPMSEIITGNIREKLNKKLELSEDQIDFVIGWLQEHQHKAVPFTMMLEKDIEMVLDQDLLQNKEGFDTQSWAWKKIKKWIDQQS